MSQNLSAFTPEMWTAEVQRVLDTALVAKEVTSFELRKYLQEGDTVHRPYIPQLTANDYVDANGVSIQDITPTDETLVVDKTQEASFYIKQQDIIQNKYSTASMFQKRAAVALKKSIDAKLLAEVVNAKSTLTAGDLNGGSGTGEITATTTNIFEIFSKAKAKLGKLDVDVEGDLFAILDFDTAAIIEEKMAASGFNVADAALKNGYAGNFNGVRIYVSNQVYTATSVKHIMFGKKGCVDLVMQKEPSLLITQPEKKIGKNYITWDLFGIKTFDTGATEMLDIQIAE